MRTDGIMERLDGEKIKCRSAAAARGLSRGPKSKEQGCALQEFALRRVIWREGATLHFLPNFCLGGARL